MRRHMWVLAGGVLVIAGVIAFAVLGPTEFGWFAYAPLDSRSFEFPDHLVFLTPDRVVACLVSVVGLVVIAGGVGYRAGQRRGGFASSKV